MASRQQVSVLSRASSCNHRVLLAFSSRGIHVSGIQRQTSDDDLLKEIRHKLKGAMQGRDQFASTVYRSILSEHQYATKADQMANKAAKPGQLVALLHKALSKRQDSAQQFRSAKPPREDLASKEDSEADLIRAFLPEQISADELESVVKAAVDEVKQIGVDGKRMMGEVMKRVNSQVDKGRAPGGMISEAVKKLLEQ